MRLFAIFIMLVSVGPTPAFAGGLSPKAEAAWQETMKQEHAFYCGGKAGACNACEVHHKGQFLGQCRAENMSSPLGAECRCASSAGWLKGFIVKIDAKLGWIGKDGQTYRKNW